MFEEFDDEMGTSRKDGAISMQTDEDPQSSNSSLKERIACHLAKSDAVLKSQQRNEPDMSFEERWTLSMEFLEAKPGNFLYRFGKYLLQDHLHYFYAFLEDPEVEYYLKELQKSLNPRTSKIQKRNRRYSALQKLKKSGSYFTESEMKSREPLLYDELIGQNLTTEEKMEQSLSAIPKNCSFSELLLHHLDNEETEARRGILKDREEDAIEETEEEEEDDDDQHQMMDQEEPESGSDPKIATGRDKIMLKEEFYSSMYCDFVRGKDKEFDYRHVDNSEEYDILDIKNRDEEERYFDEEEPEEDGDIALHSLSLSTGTKNTLSNIT